MQRSKAGNQSIMCNLQIPPRSSRGARGAIRGKSNSGEQRWGVDWRKASDEIKRPELIRSMRSSIPPSYSGRSKKPVKSVRSSNPPSYSGHKRSISGEKQFRGAEEIGRRLDSSYSRLGRGWHKRGFFLRKSQEFWNDSPVTHRDITRRD